jgi:hypothetical protein|tara:strand:- start:423 stop:632 length:210 start_codon:yes stop_codon:yes gene_type:complete
MKIIQEKSLFDQLNLSPSRSENEKYSDYVLRRKRNNHIMKKYHQHGREVFENTFPEGVTIEAMDDVVKQ